MRFCGLAYFAIFLFFLTSCNSSNEAEEILDASYVAGIDDLLRRTKHDLNYRRSNRMLIPIFNSFKQEIKNESDLSTTIESIDTLVENLRNDNL